MKKTLLLILIGAISIIAGCSEDKVPGTDSSDPSFVDVQEMDPKLVAKSNEALSDFSGIYRFQSKKMNTSYQEDVSDIYTDESVSIVYENGQLGVTTLPPLQSSLKIPLEQSQWIGTVRSARTEDNIFSASFANNKVTQKENLTKGSTFHLYNCQVGPFEEDTEAQVEYQIKSTISKLADKSISLSQIIYGQIKVSKTSALKSLLSSCAISHGKDGKIEKREVRRKVIVPSDLILKKWKLTVTHKTIDKDSKEVDVSESFYVTFEGEPDQELSKLNTRFDPSGQSETPTYLNTLIHSFTTRTFGDTAENEYSLKLDSFRKSVRFSGLISFLLDENNKPFGEGRYFKIRGEKLPPKYIFSPSEGVIEEGTLTLVEELQ